MATDHNFRIKNGLEVGGQLIVDSNGQLVVSAAGANLEFPDNTKLFFGTGSDASVFYDGSHLRFNVSSGNFNIQANINIRHQFSSQLTLMYIFRSTQRFIREKVYSGSCFSLLADFPNRINMKF